MFTTYSSGTANSSLEIKPNHIFTRVSPRSQTVQDFSSKNPVFNQLVFLFVTRPPTHPASLPRKMSSRSDSIIFTHAMLDLKYRKIIFLPTVENHTSGGANVQAEAHPMIHKATASPAIHAVRFGLKSADRINVPGHWQKENKAQLSRGSADI